MTAGSIGAPGAAPTLLPIGEAATRLGVSTRTLRYYEELGLVAPSGRTQGGSRRYAEPDVERVQHVRELQQVLGSTTRSASSRASAPSCAPPPAAIEM